MAAYETKPLGDAGAGLRERIENGQVDAILFTSSSTVTSTIEALGAGAQQLLSRITVASIGPITTRTLQAAGLKPTVQASVYTVEGLLDALEEWSAGTAR